ncbi:PREDICTED: uncharacterized protein LOC109225363 isoform X2 [Nicotiana attenuata]|uniref:uncharacterized protein LOC109225363 isoform X2 n=1 Tax=Nicotiana attenuata TaxID=49451 RepID=UPI00090597D7|nr:PREDICTED: uncharacterized protein LOC109225363 isoform X2 [Nicotiana attenuata]
MEQKHHTPSVIARLMGIDELPPQQPLPSKKRRVLSENYLRKTATIGLREKSSFSVGLSCGINTQKHQVAKHVFGVEIPDIYSHEKASQNTAKLKRKKYSDSSFTSMKEKHSYFKHSKGSSECLLSENTSRSLQRLGIGTPKDDVGECAVRHLKKINFQFDPNTHMPHPSRRIIALKPSSKKSHNTKKRSFSLRPGVECYRVDSKYKQFRKHENGAVDNDKPGRANCIYSLEPLKHGVRVPRIIAQTRNLVQHEHNHSLKLTSRAESISDTFLKAEDLKPPSSNLFSTRREDDTLYSFSKRSSFAKEEKKQIIGRWKLKNDFQEVEIARRSRSRLEMLAIDDLETRPQFLDSERDKHSFGSSFSVHAGASGLCNPLGMSSKYMNRKQKDSQEYRDLNLKEADQCSPNSVLEPPFQEEKLCASEFHGLCTVQLQFLETNSEETYSEGSEMGVSNDEHSEIGSLDLLQDSENVLPDFKVAESRDFSYLVDVLDEANLHGMNLGLRFETWHSLDCPVNPSVFDLLEKKYGKQTSWLKSERKLLFDRINSGLSEILHSFLDIYIREKSIKRRCCSALRRIDVEEELWRMLVSQENEVHKDLSGKAIGNETKWLQVEEELGSICREIEKYLFDELAAELALH